MTNETVTRFDDGGEARRDLTGGLSLAIIWPE